MASIRNRKSLPTAIMLLPFVFVCFVSCTERGGQENEEMRQMYLAADSLRRVNALLSIAAFDKPDGGGCSSIQEGVERVSLENGLLTWRSNYSSNSIVHINPDWNMWRVAATNSVLLAGKLASFCTPPINGSNGHLYIVGFSFHDELMVVTNPPPWPAVTNWLQSGFSPH